MVSRSRNDEGCAYCGALGELSDDHVPPKNLFAEPRPSNLITVPACPACHSDQTSMDDEYFRDMLFLKDDAGDHPDVRKARPALFRALRRPQQRAYTRELLRNTFRAPHVTPSGVYVGTRLAYHVDLKRLQLVVERTVRGIHYAKLGKRVPDEAVVDVFSEDGIQTDDMETVADFKRTIVDPVRLQEEHIIGDGVFSYRVLPCSDAPGTSVWILEFYGCVRFVAMVLVPPVGP